MRKFYNKGSAVIEITMLIPVFLGCIYLYIMLFLFLIESSRQMNAIAQSLYAAQGSMEENGDIRMQREGKMETAEVYEEGKLFEIHIKLQKDGSDPIENIRRWQLATGGI